MFNDAYAKHYDLMNRGKPYKAEIEFIYKWAEKPERILDVGCGTASYWKYYPDGVKIMGLEQSLEMRENSIYKDRIIAVKCAEMPLELKISTKEVRFDLVTALFDVINYNAKLEWFDSLPLVKGGYFIFDIWDKDKVLKDGFKRSHRKHEGITRTIFPSRHTENSVDLNVLLFGRGFFENELHKMYLHSKEDIEKFASKSFNIVEIKPTERWQTWWKLRKK